jgi:hypothetical protein
VQVALDAAAGLVGGGHDAGREAVSSACAWALAIAVATTSVKAARRASVPTGSGSGRAELTPIIPPQPPLHRDRAPDRGAHAKLAGHVGERAGRGVVVHPGGPAGPQHHCRHHAGVERVARSDHHLAVASPAPAGDHAHGVVWLVPQRVYQVGAEQPARLLGHRSQDLGRRHTAGDQGGHPPQGGLLLGNPLQLLARLGVGDRGRRLQARITAIR